MKTATRHNELQALGQWLQRDMQSKSPNLPPLQIQCVIKQGHLLVLVQHSGTTELGSQELCTLLAHSLRRRTKFLEAITGLSQSLPVKVYLRSHPHEQPYSAQAFTLPLASVRGIDPQDSQDPQLPLEPPGEDDAAQPLPPPADASPQEPLAIGADADGEERESEEDGSPPPAQATDTPQNTSQNEEALPETVATIRAIAQSHVPVEPRSLELGANTALPPTLSGLSRIPTSALIFSAVAGLLTALSGIYLLTRPCVLSACTPLQTAQQMGQEAEQLMQPNATAGDIRTAYNRLVEANRLLDRVPPWSGYHNQAQALMDQYGERSQIVRRVVIALQQANSAAEKSQNPPHPLSRWREVQQHWREAIVQLDSVPPTSPIAPFAKEKRQEYQRNLANIDQRILKEKDAQDGIARARSRAELAESTASAAKTVEDWSTIYDHWKAAINELQQVPQGTVGYGEAQQLLALYQPKLLTAGDRRRQEAVAEEAHQQALKFAETARQSEMQNQWSAAVQHWSDALERAERVPDGTLKFNDVRPLITTYREALSRAQKQLTIAQALQAAERDMELACLGTPVFCTYTVGTNGLEIRFLSDYDWAVERVVANVPVSDDPMTHRALKETIDTRLRSLSTIAETHTVPLELYNSYGRMFSRYDPDLSGFVAP